MGQIMSVANLGKNCFRPKVRVIVSSEGEVTIAGNRDGLRWIARLFLVLWHNPDEGHIHLQNEGDILTHDSNQCVIQCMMIDDDFETSTPIMGKCKYHFFKMLLVMSILLLVVSVVLVIIYIILM